MPKNFRIASILTIPFGLRIDHRIALIFCPSASFIQAIGYTLHLLFQVVSRINSHHRRNTILSEAGSIVIVDHCRTGKHRTVFVGIQGDRQLFPMYQIIAYCMPPMHIPPVAFIRIMLVEQVIFTVIIQQSIRIVVPSSTLSIVDLRTVGFFIQAILSGYFIRLINLVYTCFIPSIRYFYLFVLQGRYITKHPIVRFS